MADSWGADCRNGVQLAREGDSDNLRRLLLSMDPTNRNYLAQWIFFHTRMATTEVARVCVENGLDFQVDHAWKALQNAIKAGNLELVRYLVEELHISEVQRVLQYCPFPDTLASGHADVLAYLRS
jgi:hypothetical protein